MRTALGVLKGLGVLAVLGLMALGAYLALMVFGVIHVSPTSHQGPASPLSTTACFVYDPTVHRCLPYQGPSTTAPAPRSCVTATTVVQRGYPPLPAPCP